MNNVPPTIDLSGAAAVDEGSSYSLTLGAITDPGTDTVTSWIVHWGDGSQDTYPSGGAVTHTYADGPATPTITVDLVDEDGTHAGAGSKQITVNNVPPTIALSGAAAVDEGSSYSLTLGAISDPGTDTVTSWIVHWGDGSQDTYPSGGAVTHTYADGPATPTITVDLVDEDGTHAGAGSKQITVNNVAPTIDLSGAPRSTARATRSLGAITDPGTDTARAGSCTGATARRTPTRGTPTGRRHDREPRRGLELLDGDDRALHGRGHAGAGSKQITVNNVAPVLTPSRRRRRRSTTRP